MSMIPNQHRKSTGAATLRKIATLALAFVLVAVSIPLPHAEAAAVAKQIVATGGTITTVVQNGVLYKVHTFTATGSSTFRVASGSGKVWYLVVAGGGGGGSSSANSVAPVVGLVDTALMALMTLLSPLRDTRSQSEQEELLIQTVVIQYFLALLNWRWTGRELA